MALIIQNGDIYEDELGPKYQWLKTYWADPTPEGREPPRPGIFGDQANTLADFPRIQAYLREHRPPTLIVWGPHDGYMPEGSARAYLRGDQPRRDRHARPRLPRPCAQLTRFGLPRPGNARRHERASTGSG